MCLKPKKRYTAPVPFQYKKKFLGVRGRRATARGARMTLRATARRRAVCSVSSAGNIGNRPHQCNVPAPTAVPNHPTAFSSVGWPFSGHALHRNRTARPCARCERPPTDFGEVPFPPAKFLAHPHARIFMTYHNSVRRFDSSNSIVLAQLMANAKVCVCVCVCVCV